jgi:hypothetical protein
MPFRRRVVDRNCDDAAVPFEGPDPEPLDGEAVSAASLDEGKRVATDRLVDVLGKSFEDTSGSSAPELETLDDREGRSVEFDHCIEVQADTALEA